MISVQIIGTLGIAHWCAAFDAYALAAACTEQWEYTAAHTHKSLVLKVATDGRLQRQPFGVAVIYDELVRRRISTRVAAKATGYSQNNPVLEVDKVLVEKATAVYELRNLRGSQIISKSLNPLTKRICRGSLLNFLMTVRFDFKFRF